MNTLRTILESDGVETAASRLGVHPNYIRMLLRNERPVSARLLAVALEVYGDRLDVNATLRDMRAADMARAPGTPDAP